MPRYDVVTDTSGNGRFGRSVRATDVTVHRDDGGLTANDF